MRARWTSTPALLGLVPRASAISSGEEPRLFNSSALRWAIGRGDADTALRLVRGLSFFWVHLGHGEGDVLAAVVFSLASVTDFVDGYLARSRNSVTTFGKLMDPLADKLLIAATFIPLVQMGLMRAWMAVIIIGREFTILGLRNIASAEGFTIAASTLGKMKMVLQVCAVAVLIVGARHPSLNKFAEFLLWLVVISALVSAGQYFHRFWGHLDDRIKQRRKLSMLEAQKKSQDAVPL